MTRQKIAVVVGIPLVAIALVAGGVLVGGKVFDEDKVKDLSSATTSQATNNVIPLGGEQEKENTAGGLSVNSAGVSDLGQLKSDSGTSQSSVGGSSSSSSPSPKATDFKEYDKYKDQTHALFGEITKGTGAELAMSKKAIVYYRGWLTNGQMFDQSPTNNGQKQPLTFTVGAHEVVAGMEEGVLGMKVGGKRLIIIPPAVGYGATANGPVPANSVMVFEVELLNVQ